jgi:hypothetical protein
MIIESHYQLKQRVMCFREDVDATPRVTSVVGVATTGSTVKANIEI